VNGWPGESVPSDVGAQREPDEREIPRRRASDRRARRPRQTAAASLELLLDLQEPNCRWCQWLVRHDVRVQQFG
jgi:hypothetical protein